MATSLPAAEGRLQAPVGFTLAVIGAGRGTLSRLIHIDLRAMAARIADLAGESATNPTLAGASGMVRWAGIFVRNFELTLYWGIAWALAHVVVLILGEAFWAHSGTPGRLAIPLEAIPGTLFVISVVRLATSMARVRQIQALTPPRDPAAPRLVNPPAAPPLLRLLEPTDLDLVVPLLVTALLEVVAR